MKKRNIILCSIITLLSFANIINTSALSYQTDVGVSFTFNPTLSVSISPSDLTISNLTPGATDTSNEISINVSTNNVYGYNLYATVGNSNYSNTNLTYSSSNDTFTSISTTADLSNLTTDNTWGYTYSLDNGAAWSNYNGLPLYTADNPTRLRKNTGPSEDTVNFKIAAKSSTTQPSGTYTNVINFTAITKPTPVTLADAYASEGKELYHGYYKMQDMTHTICEEVEDIGTQLQVIDIRDDKVYWISKLADNNCWMTQNLDLDIDEAKTYTHNDTDLGWTMLDENATWQPAEGHSTIDFGATISNWADNNEKPYSANPGDVYYYTSNSTAKDIKYSSLQKCIDNGHDDCIHYRAGNYYNWTAATANDNTSDISSGNAANSICPAEWKLPNSTSFSYLVGFYNATSISLRQSPLYFVRSGRISDGKLSSASSVGNYLSSYTFTSSSVLILGFDQNTVSSSGNSNRYNGLSVRCLAR